MKSLLVLIVGAVLLVGCSSLPKLQVGLAAKPPEGTKQSLEDVAAFMTRYVELFNNEQTETIAEEIFLLPVLMLTSVDKTHSVKATPSEISEVYNSILQRIKSKGWKQSVVSRLDINLVGQDMATVDMRYSRLTASGQVFYTGSGRYVLVKRELGWRIISLL